MLEKDQKKIRRYKRVRAKIKGSTAIPRLSVFRSGKHIYAQLIDDDKAKVIASANDVSFTKKNSKQTKTDKARQVGKLIAEKAKKLKDVDLKLKMK